MSDYLNYSKWVFPNFQNPEQIREFVEGLEGSLGIFPNKKSQKIKSLKREKLQNGK